MKKIILAILALILTGCSALSNLPFLQSPTPAPVIVNSPQPTVTLMLPASTNTPDLFVVNTETPTSTPPSGTQPVSTKTRIPTIAPTARPTITLEAVDTSLFTPGPNP